MAKGFLHDLCFVMWDLTVKVNIVGMSVYLLGNVFSFTWMEMLFDLATWVFMKYLVPPIPWAGTL